MKNDTITLKILVDNEAQQGYLAEHGFALWVEADGKKILFDTGQAKALLHNAKVMNISLTEADLIILSHGHYDHTGGLPDVLHSPCLADVYCHAAAFQPRYSINNGMAKPVKMTSEAMISINNLPEDRIHWVTKALTLTENIGITGEIPRANNFEKTGEHYYFDQDGKRADPIKDDMALWIKTPKGLVVCIGCCHAGIINTLTYIQECTGESKIHTLIGGFRLFDMEQKLVEKTIAELKHFTIDQIIPCHCTGNAAKALLKKEFNCITGQAGMDIHI